MADRKPRTTQTREKTQRKKAWVRPSALPDPEQENGVEYRWVRTSTLGNSDTKNVSSRFREGWEAVKADEHPEMQVLPDIDSRFEGNVEVGGLLLCKNSTENVEARREYMREQASDQLESVDNNLMRESDPRMPILRPEKTTRTTFGK